MEPISKSEKYKKLKLAGKVKPEYFALCPLDGRYVQIGEKLAPYFSEFALVENRVKVEVYWLKYMLENIKSSDVLNNFDKSRIPEILSIYENFSGESIARIKEIESVTNHDVKAVELYVGEKLREMGMGELVSFVHFGCTSEDINNTSYANMIKTALSDVWLPAAENLIGNVVDMAEKTKDIPMLAHTHGQSATPTTIGKELAVFAYRLRQSLNNIETIKPRGKFNGATGNYSAVSVAFPDEDWQKHSQKFVEEYLGLDFNPVTTQIESHDYMCHIFDGIRHFNNVLLDADVDMWLYISMEYFKQIAVKTEVGSSTMPHKVNPIRFENSESNIDMSNAILLALSNKLSRSRMQRDLSDSSSQRNIGLGFGYSLQAIEQTIGGLKKVAVNEEKLARDLENNTAVLAEPIQTVLRREGNPEAYNQLKAITRGTHISPEGLNEFIDKTPEFTERDRETLKTLTPETYTGYASQIASQVVASEKSLKEDKGGKQ